MLYSEINPVEKRAKFRELLSSGELIRFPGAFSPLVAKSIQNHGFEGVYLSGAVCAASLGLPDIGLTTLAEVSRFAREVSRAVDLPTLIDADTGFGEVVNVARCQQELEAAGGSGLHLEDQVNPKRCGHLDSKQLISVDEMCKRIKSAVNARHDENFVVMARTDACGVDGLDAAIERAKAYVDAGADAIFPEALPDEAAFEKFRSAVSVPLLANMTEFGKSKLLTAEALEALGYNLVIYPVTLLRVAMGAVERGLSEIKRAGTQQALVEGMQTRARLYELINYESYNAFDESIYNFKLAAEKK